MIIEIALGIVLAVIILALLPSIIAISIPIIGVLLVVAAIWSMFVFETARTIGLILLCFILFGVMALFIRDAHHNLKSKKKAYFKFLKKLDYWIYWLQALFGGVFAFLLALAAIYSTYKSLVFPDPTLPVIGAVIFPILLLVFSILLVKYFFLYPATVLLRLRRFKRFKDE